MRKEGTGRGRGVTSIIDIYIWEEEEEGRVAVKVSTEEARGCGGEGDAGDACGGGGA